MSTIDATDRTTSEPTARRALPDPGEQVPVDYDAEEVAK
jgi:hypothetical protein